MLHWLHSFVSAKTDGTDSTLVKPSDWNDEHEVTTTVDNILLGRPAGAGPGPIQEITMKDVAGVLQLFDETILTGPAMEIRVDVPPNARHYKIEWEIMFVGGSDQNLYAQFLLGTTPIGDGIYNYQFLSMSGTGTPSAWYEPFHGQWSLGGGSALWGNFEGSLAPNPSPVIGVSGQLGMTRFSAPGRSSWYIVHDAGPVVRASVTGYRFFGSGNMQTGSAVRCYAVL